MAVAKHEYCLVRDIRLHVKQQLEVSGLPKTGTETAAEFWVRVEKAERLREALLVYDETATAWKGWEHLPQETKEEFSRRIETEGRQEKIERERKKLLASGRSQREVQAKLVETFQPLDGTKTRAWETPDPWERGRLFQRKATEQELLAREDYTYHQKVSQQKLRSQLQWARLRRDERRALAAARRRLQELTDAQTPDRPRAKTLLKRVRIRSA